MVFRSLFEKNTGNGICLFTINQNRKIKKKRKIVPAIDKFFDKFNCIFTSVDT